VFVPSFFKSMTARSERPISRWDLDRPAVDPALVESRAFRSCVE